MGFWLKKIIAMALMPLTAALVGMAAGLILLKSERRRRLGKWLAALSLLTLALLSNHYVARGLMRPLETRYAPLPEFQGDSPASIRDCAFIVVLGAGNGATTEGAAIDQLNFPGLARITEAVRIARVLPDAKLIVSGPLIGPGVTHASQLKRTAVSLGVAPERILVIDTAPDTENEARVAAGMVGKKSVALVTSAAHMPRALGLFRGVGVQAVPCPTGFRTQEFEAFTVEHLLFDVDSLSISSNAIRERIGIVWNGLRGKTR